MSVIDVTFKSNAYSGTNTVTSGNVVCKYGVSGGNCSETEPMIDGSVADGADAGWSSD